MRMRRCPGWKRGVARGGVAAAAPKAGRVAADRPRSGHRARWPGRSEGAHDICASRKAMCGLPADPPPSAWAGDVGQPYQYDEDGRAAARVGGTTVLWSLGKVVAGQ